MRPDRLMGPTLTSFIALTLSALAGDGRIVGHRVIAHALTVDASTALKVTGTITGLVRHKDTGQPIAGVTVVAQGPQGELAEVTDDRGRYTITEVPAGKYLIVFFVPGGNAPEAKKEAQVPALTTVRVNATFSHNDDGTRERPIIGGCRWPSFDTWSAKRSTKYDREYMNKIPLR